MIFEDVRAKWPADPACAPGRKHRLTISTANNRDPVLDARLCQAQNQKQLPFAFVCGAMVKES